MPIFDTFFKETGTDTTVLAQVFTSGYFLYRPVLFYRVAGFLYYLGM